MKKSVVLAMTAPLIAGPAAFAFAATPAPVSPVTQSAPSTSTQTPTTGTSGGTATSQPTQTAQTSSGTTAPPPATSSAKALDVAGVVGVGETQATANPDNSSSSTGNAITLGGSTPNAGTAGQTGQNGTTGGTATSDGTNTQNSSGAILDTGSTPLGQIAVAPWSASAAPDHSHAEAGLAHVNLGGTGGLDLKVLYSTSDAKYDPSTNTTSSNSASDGVLLNVGGGALIVDLLHADTSSSNSGSSYLASINGNEIGSNSQVNGQCQIPIPGLLTINCLSATGGTATSPASALVGTLTFTGQASALPSGTLFGVTAAGSPKAAAVPSAHVTGSGQTGNQGGASNEGGTGNQGATAAAASSTLPFTGLDAAMLASLGGALAGAGAIATRLGRRVKASA